jgi:hypothetical protein
MDYIYWCSHPESLHSKNVFRTGKIFIVLFESNAGGCVYINADNAHEPEDEELERGLRIYNRMRVRDGKNEPNFKEYCGASPQRLYSAKVNKIYVNYSQWNSKGKFIKVIRHEISKEQLNWFSLHSLQCTNDFVSVILVPMQTPKFVRRNFDIMMT